LPTLLTSTASAEEAEYLKRKAERWIKVKHMPAAGFKPAAARLAARARWLL
jgi:hypothetical protein